jgi:serine/threonine-protein kinase
MPLSSSARLGPYEILALLGTGSMGEVYTARDTRLGRLVAIKVLPDSLARDHELLKRFQQEALAASALNHPNVVSVHDVGTEGDTYYVVSELIEGQTLRARLDSSPLPLREAVACAAQIAHGLSAAHEKGIVHRDLKPENVMITADNRVKIVDFGIAKIDMASAGRAAQPTIAMGPAVTLPGSLLGTIAYMSPEQVRGGDAEPRSDIFSLGTILYEMLAGRRPFEGPTAAEVMAAILRDAPPDLPEVPPALSAIVGRCLAKSPDQRFESARAVALALEAHERESAMSPLLLRQGDTRSAGEQAIAVLPFANVDRNPDNEYFSDGLTEQLIHELTRIPDLKVVAWHSAALLRGRENDLKAIGTELGADSVLVGSVRRADDRVRITVRLARTATGRYLWSETYDRRIEDLFAIQDDIARAIARTLERRLGKAPPGHAREAASVEAYNLYLRGRYHWNRRTGDGLWKAIEAFEQAVALDANVAVIHAGLADAYCLLADYGLMVPANAMARARAAALRALELDPRSGEAHTSFAMIHSLYDHQWAEAEAFYRRAIELTPAYATAHHWLAVDFLAMLGRFDEAHEEIQIARGLDPLSLIIHEGAPYLFLLERRFDEAIAGYRALAELDPGFFKAYTGLGRSLTQRGHYAEAIEMLEKGRALEGDVPNILGALGQTHGLAGHRDKALQVLDDLEALSKRTHVASSCFALVHAGLGDADSALTWLERGCQSHELSVNALKVHPAYDSLRADPRYNRLLAELQFL